jgi:hypothetical protein
MSLPIFTGFVFPHFDEKNKNLSALTQEALDARGWADFLRAHPEWQDDKDDVNCIRMAAFCRTFDIGLTLRNCEIGLAYLKHTGGYIEVEPEPYTPYGDYGREYAARRGVKFMSSMSTVKINHAVGNDAERQLAGEENATFKFHLGQAYAAWCEERSRLHKLSGVGKPISKQLRDEYRASLAQNKTRSQEDSYKMGIARSIVGNAYPELPRYGAEFNRRVCELLSD